MHSEWFKPLRTTPKARNIIAFDTEGTGDKDGFVCGSIVGETISGFYTDRQSMFETLKGYALDGFWIFAHNLQYDIPVIEGDNFPEGEMLFTRTGILSVKYPSKRTAAKLYDSMNLFPRHSVARLGEMVGYPKLELDKEIMSKLSKGRSWNSFSPIDQSIIKSYCMRDAEIVFMSVTWLQELVLALGGQMHPTISGIAMDIFRRKYHRYPWKKVGSATNEYARPAYFGGRVENFAVGKVDKCNMYDVTSLYPSAQRIARFPHPNHLQLDLNPAINGDFWKGEGIVTGEVEIPDQFIPPLPYRYNHRLFFPIGKTHGTWTIYELRRALDWGVKLKRVDEVLYSNTLFNPFGDYVDDLFSLRSHYLSTHNQMAGAVKLLLNGLIGRWGLNPQGGLYKLVNLDTDEDISKFEGYSTYQVNGKLVGFGGLESSHYPDYINVLIAAQITSIGRMMLLDTLKEQGEKALYCDTDSILTTGKLETGDGLGAWREEMTEGSADLIGPKEYALHNAVCGTQYVAKGVPPEVAREYLEMGVTRFRHAIGIREGLRDNKRPSSWIETIRAHTEILPKRYPIPPWVETGLPYHQTRAYRAEELPLVCQGYYSSLEREFANPGRTLPTVRQKPQQIEI
jgi:hypothetical protein